MLRKTLNLVLFLAMSTTPLVMAAPPASAHFIETCTFSQQHNVDTKVRAKINHVTGQGAYVNAWTLVAVRYLSAGCGSAGGPAGVPNNVIDSWIAAQGQNFSSGSWHTCAAKTNGWRGYAANYNTGWYLANIPSGSFLHPCGFTTKTCRAHGIGKSMFTNGDIVTVHTYTQGHPHI